nr:AfsA-related hotdog domain-containing protein [Streptacidiphilus albus]
MSTALLEHSAPASTQPAATIAELVHKTRTADVLLTRWRTTGPDTHHVTAELPPTHGFYRPRHGLHDPLLLAEAVRQSIPLLTHAAYGAPPGDRQAWRDLGLRLDPTALAALAAGTGPTTLDLHITCTEVVMRARRPAAARMQVQITAQGRHLATATTTFTNHSPTVYNRLRGHHADPHHTPTPPAPRYHPPTSHAPTPATSSCHPPPPPPPTSCAPTPPTPDSSTTPSTTPPACSCSKPPAKPPTPQPPTPAPPSQPSTAPSTTTPNSTPPAPSTPTHTPPPTPHTPTAPSQPPRTTNPSSPPPSNSNPHPTTNKNTPTLFSTGSARATPTC